MSPRITTSAAEPYRFWSREEIKAGNERYVGNLKLKARDVVGCGVLQLAVHVRVVSFLCWLFARHIPYVPPIK